MNHSLRGVFISTLLVFAIVSVYAEGTKQLRPLEAHKGEICIDTTAIRCKFAWVTATADYRLHIHISDFQHEAIYFGFGEKKHNLGGTTFRLYRPDGSIDTSGTVPVTSGSRGYIDDWAHAVAGPSCVVGPTGYWGLRCTPDMNGDYYLAFKITWQGGFGAEYYQTFANFDIAVVNTTSWTLKEGRVWSKSWQIFSEMPNFGSDNQFWGKMYVYSKDSIVTRVDLNGMIPGTFSITCNESGCYPIDVLHPVTVARKSVYNYQQTYPQYKVFLNDPDITVYPSGVLGQIDNNVPIVTQRNCNGTINFTFGVTRGGNVEIHLLLSALGPPYVDRIIPSQVNIGSNSIIWDGLDGNGLAVPNGSTFQFYISYVNGLTHLPLYDVEFNQNGFRLDLIRPTTIPPPNPALYWDDSNIGGGSVNLAGCIPTVSTGCHIWNTGGNGFGNNNTINTWWYAVSTSSGNSTITEIRSPGNLGTITGPTSLCPGATTVQFSVPTDINSTSYQWAYSGTGATIIGNGNNIITVNFAVNATSGTLSVRGYNSDCGLSGVPSNLAITMQPFPPVVLNAFSPVCTSVPAFTLTGGSPAGGTYYVQGIPATTFNPGGMGAGTFTISYYFSDPITGCSKTVDQPITVNPLPNVSFAPLASVCAYVAPFTLTGGTPAGGTYSGPGVTGGNTFDPGIAGAGTHTLTYTYSDANSCTDFATQVITVLNAPVVTLADFSPVCVNTAPFALTGGNPSGGVYSGTGVTAGTFDPSVAGTGVFTITYTHTDASGCVSSDSKTITVNPLPGNAGAVSGTASLCQGSGSMIYTTSAIANATSYVWTLLPPASGTITGNTSTATVNWTAAYAGPATITVKGTNNCGDGVESLPFNIVVNPKPVTSLSVCLDSITTANAKPFALRGGIPVGGTYSGPGVNSATGIFNPATSGTGNISIRYTYNNTWGCSDFATKTIIVVNPVPFTCGGNYRDIRDNKTYRTIQIGGQCWMTDNLNHGSRITSSASQRDNCVAEKFCYADNPANCNAGGLYEWNEIMTYSETAGIQGMCPPSWHIPTDAEWTVLFNNYTNNGFAANALKYTGFSGFNALLTGSEFSNNRFKFNNWAVFYWTSTSRSQFKAWAHAMNTPDPSVSLYPSNRNHAFYVRCIKD